MCPFIRHKMFIVHMAIHLFLFNLFQGSNKREQNQSMLIVQAHINNMMRANTTRVVRVLEGQETRVPAFDGIFAAA
jgi:hypothetical protein